MQWAMPMLHFIGLFPPAPSYKQMDKYLTENITELLSVAEYLSQFDYDGISIRKYDGGSKTMSAYYIEYIPNTNIRQGSNHFDVPIADEKMIEKIEKLFERGFDYIGRSGNEYVNFSKWSILDVSRGIMYSLNGGKIEKEVLDADKIIEIKPLSIENWYYYESNFEKWKYDNIDKFKPE